MKAALGVQGERRVSMLGGSVTLSIHDGVWGESSAPNNSVTLPLPLCHLLWAQVDSACTPASGRHLKHDYQC